MQLLLSIGFPVWIVGSMPAVVCTDCSVICVFGQLSKSAVIFLMLLPTLHFTPSPISMLRPERPICSEKSTSRNSNLKNLHTIVIQFSACYSVQTVRGTSLHLPGPSLHPVHARTWEIVSVKSQHQDIASKRKIMHTNIVIPFRWQFFVHYTWIEYSYTCTPYASLPFM